MVIATLPPPTEAFAESRVMLNSISWREYMRIRKSIRSNGVRLTYNGKELEIMTVSSIHEWLAGLLGRGLQAITL